MQLRDVLTRLTSEQKHELEQFGISAQRRSNWLNGHRNPTAAQIRTLAIVANIDPAPLLLWLAEQEATPAQLDLFLKALAKAAAGLTTLTVAAILSGAQTDANAASMRVPAGSTCIESSAHYAQLI